jgi:transcription elongation factor GreA
VRGGGENDSTTLAGGWGLRRGAQILYNCWVIAQHYWYARRTGLCAAGPLTMTDLADKIKKKLQKEIAELEHELHNELPKEIKVARAHGDLSENAEYKYAKERQGYVSARLHQLHKRMADLSLLNLNNLPKDRAAYGSRIQVLDVAKNSKIEYKLVTIEEADASKGLISTSSPIGRALLGKKVGDEVQVTTPAGIKEYEVVRLQTIYDEE